LEGWTKLSRKFPINVRFYSGINMATKHGTGHGIGAFLNVRHCRILERDMLWLMTIRIPRFMKVRTALVSPSPWRLEISSPMSLDFVSDLCRLHVVLAHKPSSDKEGSFGIRIESALVVKRVTVRIDAFYF
jgi:Xaa-Pro aminopeptidase